MPKPFPDWLARKWCPTHQEVGGFERDRINEAGQALLRRKHDA